MVTVVKPAEFFVVDAGNKKVSLIYAYFNRQRYDFFVEDGYGRKVNLNDPKVMGYPAKYYVEDKGGMHPDLATALEQIGL